MTSPHGRKALRCPKMPAATGANGRPRACSHPTKRIGPSGPFGGPIPKHPGGKMGNPRSSSINRNGRFGFQQIRRADLRRQGNEAPNLDPKVPKITSRPQRGRVRKVPQVAPHGTRTHLLRQSESDQPSCEGDQKPEPRALVPLPPGSFPIVRHELPSLGHAQCQIVGGWGRRFPSGEQSSPRQKVWPRRGERGHWGTVVAFRSGQIVRASS